MKKYVERWGARTGIEKRWFSVTKQIMRMLRPQMLKNLFFQWEKVAKYNFKSKAQVHENISF